MNLGNRQFRPAWWSALLTTAAVCLFLALGSWQLDRAAYKAAVIEKHELRLLQKPRLFATGDGLEDIEFRQLLLSGSYQFENSFYLDNQVYMGQAGYLVLTPFKLEGSEQMVLVDRGWVAAGPSRQQLPALLQPLVEDSIYGTATLVDNSGYQLGEIIVAEPWPVVIPFIDFEALQDQYSPRLLPFVLRLSPDIAGHYVRSWEPVWLKPEKSRAYAVQWFSFAGVALILFIVLAFRKEK